MPQTYMPAIPEVAKAYQNDPRTQLAIAAIQNGMSTAPVAAGKYAWADGIARALQGGLGGYMARRQEKKYSEKEQAMTDEVANQVASALGNGGAAAPQGGGVVMPPQGGTPAQPAPTAMVPPQPQNMPPPQAPQMPPQAPPVDQAGGMAPQAPQGPQGGFDALGRGAPAQPVPGRNYGVADAVAELGMTPEQAQAQFGGQGGAVHSAVAQALAGGGGNPATPFPASGGTRLINAMLPITRSTESNSRDFKADGSVVTSKKGARYAMQVMPATARKPGFGITPARDDSPAEYNRVGTELLQKLTDKYDGDPAKAWAAYNAGSGRLDHAVATAAVKGGTWLSHMPAETQAYVQKNVAALGGAAGGDTQQAAADGPVPAAALAAQNGHTADPVIPGMPVRPEDRKAVQSQRLAMGKALLGTRDPYLFERAMAMLDNGMGDQFNADREALAESNKRDDTGYEAGLNDHYNATNQQRGAAYNAQSDERQFGHADRTLASQQQFQREEGATNDAFTASQNALNRASQKDLTQMQIDGRKDVASVRAQKFQNFLQTPQGAKMYSSATDAMQKNDNITASVDQFMQLNQDQDTGGLALNTGAGSWVGRSLNGKLQTMDSLVHNLAPQLRQAGQGSMSDRDLELFERSIPNIGMTREANQRRAGQVKAFVGRMNDFETHKLEAAADGQGVSFLKDWSTYRSAVPVLGKDGTPGMSFDDWKASIPQYDAQGNKK